jgi:pyridoxamine 5'-phosphate oxidase
LLGLRFTFYMATPPDVVQHGRRDAAGAGAEATMTDPLSLTDRLFGDAEPGPLDPFALFEDWFAEARASEPNDPHAMALATVDAAGDPDIRMVLLNRRDAKGFCFFTNFGSAKGAQLLAHPAAATLFHWKSLRRQVRLRGPVEMVSDAEADAYFASRPRGSQIASSMSRQSLPLVDRATMLAEFQALEASLGDGEVPRPPHWSGFRLIPTSMEFWKDGAFRLHDRVRFTRPTAEAPWSHQRLYP